MIKLKVSQVIAFNGPVGTGLLNSDKKFSVKTAFALAGFVEQMQPIIQRHNKAIRDIIIANGGTILDDGTVKHESPEKQTITASEIDSLSTADVELIGEPILQADLGDELTIAEALLLKPLTKEENQP